MSDKVEATTHGGHSFWDDVKERRVLESVAANEVQGTFAEVLSEIRKAVGKHGVLQTPLNPGMNAAQKLIILVEEIGEVARACTYDEGDTANLKDELIQVATMALAWRASLS